jgi:Mn2+/Fe2+ NRAMP family transporter
MKKPTKKSSLRRGIMNILFWSIISAAVIGPGTITTASQAGALFGFDFIWALVFSVIACLVLQEAVARLTLVSGFNLGESIASRFKNTLSRWLAVGFVAAAILIGSAAFEAGNILGAMAGIGIVSDIHPAWLVCSITGVAAIALTIPSIQVLGRFLGVLVALMGVVFLFTAIKLKPPLTEILSGTLIPRVHLAQGGTLLVLGLIGTTVVPYNLFLGSGAASEKMTLREMRMGLFIAIILGGIISIAVLVVGSSVEGTFTFESLARALTQKVGRWVVYLFAIGLFAAGFSSAITAPLATGITARSLFSNRKDKRWGPNGWYYRLTWMVVLGTGLVFGLLDVKPVPVIILAQALNGILLPFVSVFIVFVMNDIDILKPEGVNRWYQNLMLGLVVWIAMTLGFLQIDRTIYGLLNITMKGINGHILILGLCSMVFSILIWSKALNSGKKKV